MKELEAEEGNSNRGIERMGKTMKPKDVTPTTRQLPHFLGVVILFLALSIFLHINNENVQWPGV